MRALLALAFLTTAALPPAEAADKDFKAVVRAVESDLNIRHMRLPLIGFIARMAASTQGVHQLNFVVYDEVRYERPDPRQFDQMMKSAVADRWTPFVTVRSKRDHEYTYIYIRPDGEHWKMMIASFEPGEAVLMHLKLDAAAMLKDFDEPTGARRHTQRTNGK